MAIDPSECIQYVKDTNDGDNPERWPEAQVMVIGLSGSGKTEVCFEIAKTFHLYAANIPVIVLKNGKPFSGADAHKDKLKEMVNKGKPFVVGLTCDPEVLLERRCETERYKSAEQATEFSKDVWLMTERALIELEIAEQNRLYAKLGCAVVDVSDDNSAKVAKTIVDRRVGRILHHPPPGRQRTVQTERCTPA